MVISALNEFFDICVAYFQDSYSFYIYYFS